MDSLSDSRMRFGMRLVIGENARMAFDMLRLHKLRSFLTVLGVVIGITALISVSSILVGLDQDIRGFLNDYGTDTIFIFKFKPGIHTGRLSAEERQRKPLTYEDALAIRELCPSVKDVTVEVFPRVGTRRPPVTARYRDREVFSVDLNGTIPSWMDVYNGRVSKGRFFTEAEDAHRAEVAVVGWDLADGLFPDVDPIGKHILVGTTTLEVIGVLEKRKGQFFRDSGEDRAVRIPHRTYRKIFPNDDEYFIGAQAWPGKKAAAEDEVTSLLRRRRNVPFDKPDNFGISSAEAIATQFRQIMGATALLVAVISSIGLLVGGVGVMNIMLMSVTERTREIGVRKAIGARRRDIIWQFLTEAVTLTGAGGAIGVLLGVGISMLINATLPQLPSAVPLWAILLGVGVAMSVGLFFGMYPAVKAARLDPVEALRYE
jgi:putative ABC transport system permease protein